MICFLGEEDFFFVRERTKRGIMELGRDVEFGVLFFFCEVIINSFMGRDRGGFF